VNFTRRRLGLLVPALAAASTARAQDKKMVTSKVFKYEDLPAKPNGQNTGRAVFNGATHLDYPIELHLTELGPGQAPHPPHQHVHEEVLMLQSGVLDMTIGGETTRITPGSVVYAASNEQHGWRNPGSAPAQYFVFALGPKASG